MRIENRKKWFEFKRFYSGLSGYLDVVVLDQAQNPNDKKDVSIRLNTQKTWIRSKNSKWKCLRNTTALYEYIDFLELFDGKEVFNYIIEGNSYER